MLQMIMGLRSGKTQVAKEIMIDDFINGDSQKAKIVCLNGAVAYRKQAGKFIRELYDKNGKLLASGEVVSREDVITEIRMFNFQEMQEKINKYLKSKKHINL